MQGLSERMRTLAVDADAKQARVSQLEAQLLEALSKGSGGGQQATVEVQEHGCCPILGTIGHHAQLSARTCSSCTPPCPVPTLSFDVATQAKTDG